MKLTDIHTALAQLGKAPKQSLGQNFLHDQNLAEWIVEQLELQPGEPWVELGPGLGALTGFALERSENGLVIEKDGKLAGFLRERHPRLEVRHEDATKFDVRELFARGPVKVFGNLPYYVSSQVLLRFTAEPSPVAQLIFMLQREVAERLAAGPKNKDFGALTLIVGRRWRVEYLRTVPSSVFMPRPKVDSAIVRLSPRAAGELQECDAELFTRLVKKGFSQRRKQLRKMLADEIEDWPAMAAALGITETARAEELSIEQWIELTRIVAGAEEFGESDAQDVHGEVFDVVDQNDSVIGQASRNEVHARDLRHRAVHIFVFNAAGEVFLQKRSRWKDKHPQRWDSSSAGHVNAGQDYEETARREIVEELGVEAEPTEIGRIGASERTGWEFVRLYRALHEGPFRLHPAEIESGGWFKVEQVERWVAERPGDFAPGFLECFEEFQRARR